MKLILTILTATIFSAYGYGQTDPIQVFNDHKFPCDSGETTLEINICSGEKLDFADSLLNLTYHNIIKTLSKEIAKDSFQLKHERAKKTIDTESKETIQFLLKDINYNQRLRASIIKSQKTWKKLRDLNLEVASIAHEGGTARVTFENISLIADTLERIKKLRSFYDAD